MDEEKVGALRVNLGCGNRYLDGWCNVDLYAERVDTRQDMRTVEFLPGSVAEVLCVHAIEHLTRIDGANLLGRMLRWCAPGGRVVIETPDLSKCCDLLESANWPQRVAGLKGIFGGRGGDKVAWAAWLEKTADNETLRKRVVEWGRRRGGSRDTTPMLGEFGPPVMVWDRPGETHRWVWSAEELMAAAEVLGAVAVVDRPRWHGKRETRDCRVVLRPGAWRDGPYGSRPEWLSAAHER